MTDLLRAYLYERGEGETEEEREEEEQQRLDDVERSDHTKEVVTQTIFQKRRSWDTGLHRQQVMTSCFSQP